MRSELEGNPELKRKLIEAGCNVIALETEDVTYGLKMRELICNAGEVLEELKPKLVQRDFGKRGKKGKAKKDWHR